MNIQVHDDLISPTLVLTHEELTLVGVNGNAFAIMAHVNDCLKRSGNSREVQDAYRAEAMSGDYDHLLQASMRYLGDVL